MGYWKYGLIIIIIEITSKHPSFLAHLLLLLLPCQPLLVHIILCTTNAIYHPSFRSILRKSLSVLGPERMAKHFLLLPHPPLLANASSFVHRLSGRTGGRQTSRGSEGSEGSSAESREIYRISSCYVRI